MSSQFLNSSLWFHILVAVPRSFEHYILFLKVLSDDDKRRSYDNFGTADFGGATGNWSLTESSLFTVIQGFHWCCQHEGNWSSQAGKNDLLVYKKNFPLDVQTSQIKSLSKPVNLVGIWRQWNLNCDMIYYNDHITFFGEDFTLVHVWFNLHWFFNVHVHCIVLESWDRFGVN